MVRILWAGGTHWLKFNQHRDWSGDSYHVMNRNCNCFGRELVLRLVGKDVFPGWINRVADCGVCCARWVPLFPNDIAGDSGSAVPGGRRAHGASSSFAGEGRRLSSSSSSAASAAGYERLSTSSDGHSRPGRAAAMREARMKRFGGADG